MKQQSSNSKVAVTAGLRGASWTPARMQAPYTTTPFPLTTQDGQERSACCLPVRLGERSSSSCIRANS